MNSAWGMRDSYLEQVVSQALVGEGERIRGLNNCVAIASNPIYEKSAAPNTLNLQMA
jgi:hypothetical protein